MTRYRWVAARKAEGFPTTMACRVAQATRQGFYAWCRRSARGPSAAAAAEAALVAEIRGIHAGSGGAYGSPRVAAELRRRGRRVNHKRVERLMANWGIAGVHARRRRRAKPTGDLQAAPADLVRRDFTPGAPDAIWAGGITFVPTAQGWLHLAVVLDVGSRRLIGYSMAPDMRSRPVVDALEMAVAARGGHAAGVIFHSDRGCQYLGREHSAALTRHGLHQSAGRVGNCWDNSVVESFFASLKRELISRRRFATREEARRDIFTWLAGYNTQRLHSSLNYQTPTEWEDQHRQTHELDQAA